MPFPRILVLAAILLAAAGCTPADAGSTVNGEGFGALRFGMKIAEGERALGVKLQPDNPDDVDDDACRYYHPLNAFPGLSFMTVDGVIARLDVYDSREITTDMGAKIGDAEARMLDLYKDRVTVEPHHYTGPEGHYLVVRGGDGKVQMVFETDGSKVINYRAGREPEVQYVEGCS